MVICKICGYEAKDSLQRHLKGAHDINVPIYHKRFPGHRAYSQELEEKHRIKVLKRDPEYKAKLSQQQRERWKDKVYREGQSKALKKGQNTEEARKNHKAGAERYYGSRTKQQREATVEQIKKSWEDKEKRENRVTALRKAHRTEEARKRHSKATEKFLQQLTPEERAKRNENFKKVWSLPENRSKIIKLSKNGLKAAMSPEARKKHKEALNTPEAKRRARMQMLKTLQNMPKVSSLNKRFKEALNQNGLHPKSEYLIGFYQVDFCFLKERVIVEVDGDYWHGNPALYTTFNANQKRVMSKDKRECTYFKNLGWTFLRFWESDINKDINGCIKQVQEALQ